MAIRLLKRHRVGLVLLGFLVPSRAPAAYRLHDRQVRAVVIRARRQSWSAS
jgi:hypothetical protein